MKLIRLVVCGIAPLLVCGGLAAGAQEVLSADAIMARVAEYQDRIEGARARYVYVQHARVVSRKGKTVMCEEVTDYRVTPSGDGSQRELVKLAGRMLTKHQYVTYTALPPIKRDEGSTVKTGDHSIGISLGDDETDRDLVENMRSSFTDDKSKDGINKQLFPLTSKTQADYLFTLKGRERMNGREVFHIVFRPKDKSDFDWKGDAFIDADAYEPVVVRTDLARKVPMAVRMMLGTNVPGLGFSVVYAPQPDGVWLPVSFGTEFKIRVLFFFNRQIVINAENREFQKTHVASKIVGLETE